MPAAANHSSAHEHGQVLRVEHPVEWLSDWKPSPTRDPLAILQRLAAGRNPDLVAKRNHDMAASGFSFLRGAAGVMAEDLKGALRDTSHLQIDICGDAHISTFGSYYSPERARVFDLNDFDEARAGPWEWDVCRLAASVAVACREFVGGELSAEATGRMVAAYVTTLKRLAVSPVIDRWYVLARVPGFEENDDLQRSNAAREHLAKLFAETSIHTQADTVKKFITDDGSGVMFEESEAPPVSEEESAGVISAYATYLTTLPRGLQRLLAGYSPICVGSRAAGEGSLGLRDYLVKVAADTSEDALILQFKEAAPSALDRALGPQPHVDDGERVVTMQRTLQGVSDPLVGWTSVDGRPFYVRQFRDGKAVPDLAKAGDKQFSAYAALCGATLAHAHARSADPHDDVIGEIAGYIGVTDPQVNEFTKATSSFAQRYAKLTQEDKQKLAEAATQAGV